MRVPKWVYWLVGAIVVSALLTSFLGMRVEGFEAKSTSLKATDCPDNTRSQDGSCLMVNTLEYPTSAQVGKSAM
jgi:hypothetical protein